MWLILLLAIGAAALFFWQQAQRVRAQEAAVEEIVSASYRLWHSAVVNGDLELFLFQQSSQDALWKSGQRDLFLQQRLLNRPELGLLYEVTGEAADIVEVELAPDWQTATVTVDHSYATAGDEQLQRPLHLHQTYFYNRYGERWLLSPGDDEFWGALQRLELGRLNIIFPQRDRLIAERIGADLAGDLQEICDSIPDDPLTCLDELQLTVRFERDPLLLASLRDTFTPVFRGGDFVLPAPTLVGLPQDEAGYRLLYEGYTARILNAMRQNLNPPIALPEEELQLLCFPAEGRSPRLFRFVPASGRWTAELGEQSFRYLMPGPLGDGVILQAFLRGEDAARLRLHWWRDGHQQLIFDQEMQQQTTRPAGWAASDQPRLLLQGIGEAQAAQHRWLDLNSCGPDGCAVIDLPGYTTWSPDGRQTLVQEGQLLWRGDALGRPLAPLGAGLSPFWLDDERYGYVRYDHEAGAPSMQIATAVAGEDLPRIVLPVAELARRLDENNPPLLFINHVAANPGDSDRLLIAATTVGLATAKYTIFSLRLSSGELQLLQQFERLPSGYPSLLTPAGYPPFRVSPDGRWLLVTLLANPSPSTWTFALYDLQEQESLAVSAYYPPYPSQFPFYDWTPDGRWLAIVEDGFLRLIAPAHGYQKLVTHGEGDCLYVAWVD